MFLLGLPVFLNPDSYPGYVGKDYEELLAVVVTMFVSFGIMVAFGAWWQR